MEKLCNKIDALNERIGKVIAWFILAMVFVTFLVVVLRYGFNYGRIALQESFASAQSKNRNDDRTRSTLGRL